MGVKYPPFFIMATINYEALDDAYINGVFSVHWYGYHRTVARYNHCVISAIQLFDIINDPQNLDRGYSLHDLMVISQLSYNYTAQLTCWLYRKYLTRRVKAKNETGKLYNLYLPNWEFESCYKNLSPYKTH